jgi:glutathione S-transferase
MTASPKLTLIHVPVSHYSEKARWALDYKRVPHVRRWPPGGFHPLVCWILTRRKHQTVPVLVMDGEGIGDSTEIIRRLEERFPEPPLYPADPDERRRALELEDFLDEELGGYVRRLVYHHLTSDPEMLIELTQHQVQYGHEATMGLNTRILKAFLDLRFATSSPERARHAEEKVLAALDRLDAELDGREYLAGDRFSVADLTAAALLYPFTMPPQAPWRPTKLPQAWVDFSEANRERPCHDWALAMYERHRAPAPAAAPAAAPA